MFDYVSGGGAPVVFAATVKLPEFWQHDLDPWFQHIEAQFNLQGITTDDTKYYHVVTALDSSTTPPCDGIAEGPTGGRKIRRSEGTAPTVVPAERAGRLLSLSGLGDSKPTELMENMLALLGSGDATFLFIQLFCPHCSGQFASGVHKGLPGVGGGGRQDPAGVSTIQCACHASTAASAPAGGEGGSSGGCCV